MDYVFHESLVADAPVIEGLHMIGSHYASHNFGHFMLDMVPLLDAAASLGVPMLSRPRTEWQTIIGGAPACATVRCARSASAACA